MTASDLRYPVLCFTKYGIATKKTDAELTTSFQASLKKGWFRNAEIIDSNGVNYRVADAKKSGGVGPFFGYSLFFSRRIKVDLAIEKMADAVPVADVRQRILKDFRDWHGWESRGDFDELKAAVEKASTVGEIIRLVTS
jgi:hypothetical protein